MDLNIESIVRDVLERRECKRLRRHATREIPDTLERANIKNVNAELRARGFRPFRTIEAVVRAANARPLPSLEFRKPPPRTCQNLSCRTTVGEHSSRSAQG